MTIPESRQMTDPNCTIHGVYMDRTTSMAFCTCPPESRQMTDDPLDEKRFEVEGGLFSDSPMSVSADPKVHRRHDPERRGEMEVCRVCGKEREAFPTRGGNPREWRTPTRVTNG